MHYLKDLLPYWYCMLYGIGHAYSYSFLFLFPHLFTIAFGSVESKFVAIIIGLLSFHYIILKLEWVQYVLIKVYEVKNIY